jgi:electron transfer flavoprotein alpha subunit
VIAVVPVRGGQLPAGGLETVAECGGRALLIGSDTMVASEALHGAATEITLMEVGGFAAGAWAHTLEGVVAHELHVVLPASPDGRDLAPRLAALLGRPLFAGATLVSPNKIDLARRGGLVLETASPSGPFVATLQPGIRGVDIISDAKPTITQWAAPLHHNSAASNSAASNSAASNSAASNSAAADVPAPHDAVLVRETPPDVTTMDLSEAPRIVGGGAGLDSQVRFEQLGRIAERLGASMGATRVITDRHWIEHERQIGTTGVVVDPTLYLAFGVSGAVQHTSGLGNPNHIISVNVDPHCPMMSMADVAIVADANATLEALEQLLS